MQTQSFIRMQQVEAITGLKKTTIYRLIRDNKFPAPILIGERASAWVASEVQAWINAKIKESRP